MTSSNTQPEIIMAGGLAGNPAGYSNLSSLEITYQNLLSGAADIVVAGGGTKTLTLTSGAIATAAPFMADLTETSAQVAKNAAVLKKIADFCNANGITVRVDANLTWWPTWTSGAGMGNNELVDQWAPVAAAAGLPITGVEDVQEISTCYDPSTFAKYAGIEVNAVRTLINDYEGSSYHMTASNLALGDMEGGNPSVNLVWWKALDAAAAASGMPTLSYATADTGWFGPWIGSMSQSSWQGYLKGMSAAAASEHMSLNVVVQGVETSTSANQFVQQAEQNAAGLAMLQATGAIHVDSIMIQSWGVLPVGVAMITSPTSSSNEAAEIQATYPLYAAGLITAQGAAAISAPGQIVLNTGTLWSTMSLSLQWATSDILAGKRLAVVVIDQTGTLTAARHGSGTVSSLASNILVLDGNAADLASELKSVTLLELNAGPDTIDIETYNSQGRVSDNQISVLAAAPGQSVTAISSSSDRQGWVASSAVLNTGTVVTDRSALLSETLYWNTTGTLAGTTLSTAAVGQSAFVNIASVHDPLAEYGVEKAPASLLGVAGGAAVSIYDPKVDYGAFPANGYANNPGVNNVGFAPLPSWISGAFNAAAQLRPLVVSSTVNTFDPSSGKLQASVANLAPDPITVVDLTGTHLDDFATAFNNGGTQVTEYNTGNNPAWKAAWGSQFSAATLTYAGSGQLVELFLQGGSSNPWFTIDDVFDPNSGKLWEQFQSTTPPPAAAGTMNYATTTNAYQPGYATGPLYVTQFNTGNNPNWDYVDWGSSISVDTEVWTDYFIMENFPSFVESFPGQYAGALNAYPYQFVNGNALDLLYVPGRIVVNLNALGTVTIASQTMASGLNGLSAINAGGATGIVTITGLAVGGSTLVGGDYASTITGYGHDTIIAGAGATTINTGSGASTIQVTAAASKVTVAGSNNVIIAIGGSTVSLTGSKDILNGSGVAISLATAGTTTTVNGNSDTISILNGGTVTQTGAGDVLNYISGGRLNMSSSTSSTVVTGNGVTVCMNANGAAVTATGDNDFIIGGATAIISLAGDHGVIGASSGAVVTINGQDAVISGSGITIAATSNSSITVNGTNDTINVINPSITVAGSSSNAGKAGAASLTTLGATARLHVQTTAASAGVLVNAGSGGATLEITTGGTAVLNGGDANLTVQLDATANLYLGGMAFITAVGAATGHNRITAGGANQTLKSIGGHDTLVGSSSFGDTFLGTATGLAGDTILNFGRGDIIDISDLNFASLKPLALTTSSGTLLAADATHGVKLTMVGSYTSSSFAAASDSHGGTFLRLTGH